MLGFSSTEIILLIITAGITLATSILFIFLFRISKVKLHVTMALLGIIGLIIAGFDIATVFLWSGEETRSIADKLFQLKHIVIAYQIPVTFLYLREELKISDSIKKIHMGLYFLGLGVALFISIVALVNLDSYVSTIDLSHLVHPYWIHEDQISPIIFRNILLLCIFTYALIINVVEMIRFKTIPHLEIIPGLFLLFFIALDDVIYDLSSTHSSIFPEITLPRYSLGIALLLLGAILRMIGNFFQDFTKEQETKDRNQNWYLDSEYQDEITELQNRKAFLFDVEDFLNRPAKQSLGERIIMILDLDNFHAIIQSYGNVIGHKLMHKVAHRLKRYFQTGLHQVYRGIGDEFYLNLSRFMDQRPIQEIAKSVLNIFQKSFRLGKQDIYLTASIGIVVIPTEANNFLEIDKALHTVLNDAKKDKNTFRIFKKIQVQKTEKRANQINAIRRSLEDDQFSLVYQGICDRRGTIVNLEALLRSNHHNLKNLSPGIYIPIAEDAGLIHAVGSWVLRKAFQDAAELYHHGYTTPISVNISPKQLSSMELCTTVISLIDEYNLPPSQIHFEITETAIMQKIDKNIMVLESLKNSGFTIAMDDFGKEYSSLNKLSKLPIDKLKIDKSFVDELPADETSLALVSSILFLSKKLHLQTVAEGIGFQSQLDTLHEMGCDLFQGFFICPPMLLNDLLKQQKLDRNMSVF